MKTLFLGLSVILTLSCVVPYVRDIIKGTTKPNLVSWITWTLLTGIATLAALSAGELVAAIFTGSAAIETFIVVLLGLKYGYVKYTAFDITCQVGAAIGLILWWFFNSPAVAVVAAVVIDLIGGIPTVRHAWVAPHEETWLTFGLAAAGGVCALLALKTYNWTSLPYAVYIVLINTAIVAAILLSAKRSETRQRHG